MTSDTAPNHTMKDLVLYFLKLGYSGFGGPVALVGYMHRDLVDRNKWYTEEEYKEGLTLAQLAPGPLAAQLGIYLAYIKHGLAGATLSILAFVLPSFVMVTLLGIAYKVFNGLPWMQAAFYGVGGAVIGIIALSSYRLTTKSIGQFNLESFRSKWILWLFFLTTFAGIFTLKNYFLPLFLIAGLLYMFIKAPPKISRNSTNSLILLSALGFWDFDTKKLGEMAWFFLQAGGFVFGSGLAIIPFLHGAVTDHHWITETMFLDAVAVAMITPGPVVVTVAFIGYLTAGFPGACVAAFMTFLPCYLMTVIPAPYWKKYSKNKSIKAFVEGITAAVIGALAGSVIVIAIGTFTQNHKVTLDIPSVLIAIGTLLTLIYVRKVQEPVIILIAAIIGLILKLAI
jgi:chromate transporter